jgi:hypothetical protein
MNVHKHLNKTIATTLLFLAVNVVCQAQVFSPDNNIKVVVEMQPAGQGGLGQAYFKVLQVSTY